MPVPPPDFAILQQQAAQRREIEHLITQTFAPEDAILQIALEAAKQAHLPAIHISPLQGKLLQFLATLCHARTILEIGSLAGYSGLWLTKALPPDGLLTTIEINPLHAQVTRDVFRQANLEYCTDVREGSALEILPQLKQEHPFDLVFLDADRSNYPHYLDWALRLTRTGSIIVADNCLLAGRVYKKTNDAGRAGITSYLHRLANDPCLMALALAMDDDYTDGFAIAMIR